MTQNAKLLNWLETKGPITQLTAFNALGVCRLSERIRELEQLGYTIEHTLVEAPSRDGTAHVMQYRLISLPATQDRTEASVAGPKGNDINPALAAPLTNSVPTSNSLVTCYYKDKEGKERSYQVAA